MHSLGVREVFTEASLISRPLFENQGFTVKEEQSVERRGIMLRRSAMAKTPGLKTRD